MRARLPLYSLVGWTLFVWVTRTRNVITDDDLTNFGMAWRVGAAVVFVVLALAALVAARRWPARATLLLGALVLWTTGWWLIRGVGILLDDHEVGFKIVHSILMIVSIELAMWAWKRRDR